MQVPKTFLKRRGSVYYLHYFENGVRQRMSLKTSVLQIAREKQRQFESARARGATDVFPTETPLEVALTHYIQHMKNTRTRRALWTDLCYLRGAFGPVCDALQSVRNGAGRSRGNRATGPTPRIQAQYLEQITTAQIAQFIRDRVERDGIAPKTANRYREVLSRLFSWSMKQNGVRTPGLVNPAKQVDRYRERAPEIRFLNLTEVDQQLTFLENDVQLQTMVAVYIFAGLRREEALWLTIDDVDLDSGPQGMIRVRAKTIDGEFWQPKTKVNRVVPVSRALRKYLDDYRPATSLFHWYFPNPAGNRWNPDCFSDRLRQVNRAVDVPWSCLDYRHTFGSQLAMKGESLYKISALMGNSPGICRKHYAALLPESLTESVEFSNPDSPSAPPPSNLVAFRP